MAVLAIVLRPFVWLIAVLVRLRATFGTAIRGVITNRTRAFLSSLVLESRLPVGSSASSSGGSLTSARAMATRCCCPPDSWFG